MYLIEALHLPYVPDWGPFTSIIVPDWGSFTSINLNYVPDWGHFTSINLKYVPDEPSSIILNLFENSFTSFNLNYIPDSPSLPLIWIMSVSGAPSLPLI